VTLKGAIYAGLISCELKIQNVHILIGLDFDTSQATYKNSSDTGLIW
jgi:hypothetical protein